MERPYEIPDPLEITPWRERDYERWLAENRTGRKCTAVIDEPRGCQCCVFHGTRWSNPFRSGPSEMWGGHDEPGTCGVFCTIGHNGIVAVVDRGDRDYKPDWCPLVPVEAPC